MGCTFAPPPSPPLKPNHDQRQRQTESFIILNINSHAGGVELWPELPNLPLPGAPSTGVSPIKESKSQNCDDGDPT